MSGRLLYGERTVDAGAIVTQPNDDFSDDAVIAGVDWTMRLEPFIPHIQPGQDTGQAVEKREIVGAAVAAQDSTGFRVEKLNPNTDEWGELNDVFATYRVGESQDVEPEAREECNQVKMSGTEYDPRFRVVKDFPGPLTILELTPKLGA